MKRLARVVAGIVLLALTVAGLLRLMRHPEPEAVDVRTMLPEEPSQIPVQDLGSGDVTVDPRLPGIPEIVKDSLVDPVEPREPEPALEEPEPEIPPPVSAPNPEVESLFSVRVKDVVNRYKVLGLFVMPGDTVEIESTIDLPGDGYTLTSTSGRTTKGTSEHWRWIAPEKPGAYVVRLDGPFQEMVFNVFVKTPFNNSDPVLDGYVIGSYQSRPLRGDPRYLPPDGLIEVNDETEDLLVSPHFKLASFTCHQPGDPKFVALDERLLLKLELIIERAKEKGIKAKTFTVMSGYRTPHYNKAIGNTTIYSMHLFGRAADVYVDEDRDGRMDDLNNDGRVDIDDARVLYDLVDDLGSEDWYRPYVGGLGLYGPNARRGPFVHVDSRGFKARW